MEWVTEAWRTGRNSRFRHSCRQHPNSMVPTARPLFGKAHWPFFILLTGAIAWVFWPVLGFEFVRWDDDINITQNPLLTRPWSWSLVGQFFSAEQALRFKPLHWLFD